MMAIDKPQSLTLDQLRRQIDSIDDRLHELLIGRGDLVEAVGRLKRSDRVAPFRPGREAQILRRLVSRHRGRFPRAALVQIWREILSGSVEMQTDLSVAVCEGCWDMARDHFGGRAPMMAVSSPDEAVLAVGEGRATVGVVPLPDDDDPAPWWAALAKSGVHRPRVVARLPFGVFGNAADPYRDAFVIAAMEPEASGEDDTLLVVAAPDTVGAPDIAGAFLAAKFECNPVASLRGDGTMTHLVEVEEFLADGDPRIGHAVGRLGAGARWDWIGAYARPLPDAALDGIAPE